MHGNPPSRASTHTFKPKFIYKFIISSRCWMIHKVDQNRVTSFSNNALSTKNLNKFIYLFIRKPTAIHYEKT